MGSGERQRVRRGEEVGRGVVSSSVLSEVLIS
jgi:hypothetical protein